MPLYLQEPRTDTANYIVRGTHLGHPLHRSTKTRDRKVASRLMQAWKRDIESGAFEGKTPKNNFATAAVSYKQAGGDGRWIEQIALQLGNTPIRHITQANVDTAAVAIYPDATPATRNRHVYSVVSAVLRHAGVRLDLRRPKGANGKKRNTWLEPEEAFALLDAAEQIGPAFGALCTFLLYTGCRKGEGLTLTWENVDLSRATAYIPKTKNGDPRTVFLPETVIASLANLPAERKGRVFGMARCSAERWWNLAAERAGLNLDRVAFHVLRHTYGAWMRRFAGMDTAGLVGTGAWRSRESASVYEHVDTSKEARKAALLPKRA